MKYLLKVLILVSVFSSSYGQVPTKDVFEYGYDSVLVLSQRVLSVHPENVWVRYSRVQGLLYIKENETAHRELLLAIDFLKSSKPDQYDAVRASDISSMLRFNFKDDENANKFADYILSKDPHSLTGLEAKASSLRNMAFYDDAIKLYKNLIEKSPRKTVFDVHIVGTYFHSIAACYEGKRQYFNAIQNYTEAIKLGDTYYLSYSGRAGCKSNLSDYRGALADYEIALKSFNVKDNQYYNLLNYRTYTKSELKKYDEAILDATSVILSSADKDIKCYAYFLRAFAKHDLKNKAGACLDWSKAGELGEERAYLAIKEFCK